MAALLTLDRGNSTLDCMVHPDGRRVCLTAGDVAGLRAFLQGTVVDRCVGVSVVPGGLDDPAGVLAERRVMVLRAGVDLPCPLRLDYGTPETLGADRWVGCLAAHRAFGTAVVVDCGSATTVNLVDAGGTFRGGAIAPGLLACQSGLAAVAPGLPVANAGGAVAMPARTTQGAVDTGLVLGYCGLVERLVADLQVAAGQPVTVVITGGNASLYLAHGRLGGEHVPDLVHRGLRLLSEAGR